MKRIVKLLILLGIIFFIYSLFSKGDATDSNTEAAKEALATVAPAPQIKQGTVTVINTVDETGSPISGTVFTILDADSDTVIDTLTTDTTGKATSDLLDYGTEYTIKQQKVSVPYALSEDEHSFTLNKSSLKITTTNSIPDYIKDYELDADGALVIKDVYLDVDTVMQLPELPNGCEITALTAVLNYYGYKATKTEMADVYLPKQAFSSKNNKLYGPDPYKAYAGDPRELKGGFFSFAPPVVDAANRYFDAIGRSSDTEDMSGSTREQIIEQLNAGIPVVIWTTLDLSPPQINYGWYFNDTGEYYKAPVNLHVVVLNGYEDGIVHVMNPLEGQVTYNADAFFNSYEEMGSHAMIVEN